MSANIFGKNMKVIATVYISALIAAMTLSGCSSGLQAGSMPVSNQQITGSAPGGS